VSLILLATLPTSTSTTTSSTFQELGSPRPTVTSPTGAAAATTGFSRYFRGKKQAGTAAAAGVAGGGPGASGGGAGLGGGLGLMSGVRFSSTGEDLTQLRHPSQPANQLNR
jgi:hypothetical protein